MHTITFECETITPMFLAGADGKTPELRAPSVKGALRFWWRALNGGYSSIEELRREESKLFGGAGDNEAKRSKVIIRTEKIEDFKPNYVLPDYMRRRTPFFGKFKVVLQSQEKDVDALKNAEYAFWAFAMFGAIGTKARTGYGNLCISNKTEKPENILNSKLSFPINVNDNEQLNEFLNSNLTIIKSQLPSAKSNYSNKFANLGNFTFEVLNSFNDSTKAQKELKKAYKERKNSNRWINPKRGITLSRYTIMILKIIKSKLTNSKELFFPVIVSFKEVQL